METHQSACSTLTIEEFDAVFGFAKDDGYPVPVVREGKSIFVSPALIERYSSGGAIRQAGSNA